MASTAVVFDIGGVLFDWHPRFLYQKLIADEHEREAFLRDVVTAEWHFQHDAGRDFADTSAELIAAYPQHGDLIRAWQPRFNESNGGAIRGMHALVAELASRDVPLFGITNFSHEFFPPFRDEHAALFAPFRDIVVSGAEKLMKPDPAIYRLALARFDLRPGEGLFVDDRLDNAEAAQANGFVGHHFVDAPTLRTRLVRERLLA